jgi:Uma2 family endonuclease
MLRSAITPLTVHDYRELPEGPPYYQLIEGDLFIGPSPDLFHQDVIGNLYFIIRGFLKKRPLGTVHLSPSDVELSDLNVYQPDLYFVSNARRNILGRQGVEGAPDLVVEILSPRTAKLDKGVKRGVYARTGVEELWIVDTELKEVHVSHFAKSPDKPVGIYKIKQTIQTPLLPGLKFSVKEIFER